MKIKCSGTKKNGERCGVTFNSGAINTKLYCVHHKDQNEGYKGDEKPAPTQGELFDATQTSRVHNIRLVERARPPKIDKPPVINKENHMPNSLLTLGGPRDMGGNGPIVRDTLEFFFQGLYNQYGTAATLGGAKGADTDAAAACLRVGMPYHLFLPAGYEDNYFKPGTVERQKFDAMLARAADVRRIGGLPFNWRNNFVRNEAMVAHTLTANHPFFFAVSATDPRIIVRPGDNTKGGTAHAIRTMYKAGVKEIYWLNLNSPTTVEVINIREEK